MGIHAHHTMTSGGGADERREGILLDQILQAFGASRPEVGIAAAGGGPLAGCILLSRR